MTFVHKDGNVRSMTELSSAPPAPNRPSHAPTYPVRHDRAHEWFRE